MYSKNNYSPMMGKKGDMSHRLHGAVKSAAMFASDPYVQFGTSLLYPEIGAGLALAKNTGVLQKLSK
jgi:hypothetical protein